MIVTKVEVCKAPSDEGAGGQADWGREPAPHRFSLPPTRFAGHLPRQREAFLFPQNILRNFAQGLGGLHVIAVALGQVTQR